MKCLERSASTLAKASSGCPIVTTVVVFIFYLLFNVLETIVEKLVFGERFEHWLDPLFVGCFIAYSAYSVYACAVHNTNNP